MICHINDSIWGVEEIHNLRLPKYEMAVRFTEKRVDGYYVFLAKSLGVEIWQFDNREFGILCGEEFYHIELLDDKGLKIVFRHRAKSVKPLFERNFFLIEDESLWGTSYSIYSMIDRRDLQKILEDKVGPKVKVTVEPTSKEQPMLIRIDAPYISARFLLEAPTEEDHLVLNHWSGDEEYIRDFDNFVEEMQIRCKEAEVAEYYENCGGYVVNGRPVVGLFSPAKYLGETRYEFHPDEIFYHVAIPRLLEENQLIQILPEKPCPFLGQGIENFRYTIKPSHDMILITKRDAEKEESFAIKIPSECIGLHQTDNDSFIAILRGYDDEHGRLITFYKDDSSPDGYAWHDLGGKHSRSYVVLDNCIMDDNIIVYENRSDKEYATAYSLKMWSLTKNASCDVIDDFTELENINSDIYVNHASTQLLVTPAGSDMEPRILVALRVYRPRDYCDVYALFDPKNRYRIYGKTYNILADKMTKKPKTLRDLVRIFKENEELKLKIPKRVDPL